MKTAEEKVASLHAKMTARREKQERRKTAATGAGCAGLLVCLTALIFSESRSHIGSTASPYSGAMMLFEDAGAYVALAVAAFMAGVVVAVVCIHLKEKRKRRK